ncbi:glycosyltransferase family 2 protein [Rhodobacteraceae bacterium]|nr:glycosyltransferase family 2 protein [Paracoccaceae bacterium]
MNNPSSLLVASVKNEGPNILEWIAHHRLCGFDRIQVYHHDSTDTTSATLRTLDRLGVIECVENQYDGDEHQLRACKQSAQSEAYAQADWCMVLGVEDFLAIKTGAGKIHDLIKACPDESDAILLNARVFGSNGQRTLGQDLITQRFQKAEPVDDIITGQLSTFKTLFRTTAYERPGPYLPQGSLKGSPAVCNGSGLQEDAFLRKNWRGNDPLGRKFAQVNHYGLRDLESFLLKYDRDHAAGTAQTMGQGFWARYDRNEQEDLLLVDRAPELWAEMTRLNEMSNGRLLRLRKRAIHRWRTALNGLLERREMAALRNALLNRDEHQPKGDSMVTPFRMPGRQPVFTSVRTPKPEPMPIRKTLAG